MRRERGPHELTHMLALDQHGASGGQASPHRTARQGFATDPARRAEARDRRRSTTLRGGTTKWQLINVRVAGGVSHPWPPTSKRRSPAREDVRHICRARRTSGAVRRRAKLVARVAPRADARPSAWKSRRRLGRAVAAHVIFGSMARAQAGCALAVPICCVHEAVAALKYRRTTTGQIAALKRRRMDDRLQPPKRGCGISVPACVRRPYTNTINGESAVAPGGAVRHQARRRAPRGRA